MLEKPIITLTTDFGIKDPFVGLMKGVILGINPNAQIIDITHHISRHNIFETSQVILMSYKYFPPSSIHVVVVDPGVGSGRRPLLVLTKDHYFLGPDNGIFTPILEELEHDSFKVIHITSSHYYLPMSGSTFHGRDIFAPVAAWLSKGIDCYKFGEEIADYVTIPSTKAEFKNNIIRGNIISIDGFGNAITNITKEHLTRLLPDLSKGKFKIIYKDRQLSMVNYYAEKGKPELSAIINSFGHLELFIYKGSASKEFDITIGECVSVTLMN